MNPALAAPDRQRLAGIDAEIIHEQSRPDGESRARANQLAGNSSRQSVMYFPQKTPSASISFGVSSGRNSGSKLRPNRAVNT
jgi:hypothetical protein